MRELFESLPPEDPMEAARRGARSALRRRFYNRASVAATPEGHAVRLDDKPVRTPARRILAAPSPALAQQIVEEWEAQRDLIDPAKMPLTRLANTIIDGVTDRPDPVAAEIGNYLGSDLLFYRAGAQQGLRERQARLWDPVLAWADEKFGVRFRLAEGVMPIAQPEEALAVLRAAIPKEPWALGALHTLTTLTGSALLALAIAAGRLSTEEAWQAAHVDEDWNMEQWGRDALALDRRAYRFAELQAAATVLHHR